MGAPFFRALVWAGVLLAVVQGSRGAPAAPQATADGYLRLNFDFLASYPITPPAFDPSVPLKAQAARTQEQIPARVKSWDGKKAVVSGYMVPSKTEGGRATELLLTRDTYAAGNVNARTINEWVIVRIKPGVAAQTLLPVSFYGVLRISPVFEEGYVTGIYVLEAERMAEIPVY